MAGSSGWMAAHTSSGTSCSALVRVIEEVAMAPIIPHPPDLVKRPLNRLGRGLRSWALCIRTGPLTSTFAACFPPPGRHMVAAERSESA